MKKLLSFTILGTLALAQSAFAATENITVPDCSLGVYPYNPTGAEKQGNAALDYFEGLAGFNLNPAVLSDIYNKVTQNDCRNRVPMNSEHLPGVDAPNYVSELKNWYSQYLTDTQKTVKIPYVRHQHTYINNSLEDTNFYKSLVYSFVITLEKDAFTNTEINNLQCITEIPVGYNPANATDLVDCDGYAADLWGGTSVTKTVDSVNKKVIVEWKYGVDGKNGRYFYNPNDSNVGVNRVPYVYGNNPGMQNGFASFDPSVDLSNPMNPYRTFHPYVTLKSRDNLNNEFWSATTTSKILLRNYQIQTSPVTVNGKTYDPNTDFGEFDHIYCQQLDRPDLGWCPSKVNGGEGLTLKLLNTDTNQEVSRARYFWHDIGNVSSIWQQPPLEETPILNCADLQWAEPFKKEGLMGMYWPDTVNPYALLPFEDAIMHFNTIYETDTTGNGVKRPLEYRWVSFNGDQNRPGWFFNQDKFFMQPVIEMKPALEMMPFITSFLPPHLLTLAHAATPKPTGVSDSINDMTMQPNPAVTPITDDSSYKSSITLKTGSAVEMVTTDNKDLLSNMVFLGQFKDEITAVLSGNPITDDDTQVYYSGGSEGVTLGVQAFYTDIDFISTDPIVDVGNGVFRQKAPSCHLELTIQPEPVTCIDLELSPKNIEPNTPVEFTVTPKFKPSQKTIPLNYRWSAKFKPLGSMGVIDLGIQGAIKAVMDPSKIGAIPGATDDDDEPTWAGKFIQKAGNAALQSQLTKDPCANGICDIIVNTPVEEPVGPIIVNPVNEFKPTYKEESFKTIDVMNFGKTSLFDTDLSAAEYGKAAAIGPKDISLMQPSKAGIIGASKAPTIPFNLQYGGFKDSETAAEMATNPYLETNDNKTWYTGGPESTLIKVQAEDKNGKVYPLCEDETTIPSTPGAECQKLQVNFYDGNTKVAIADLEAGTEYRVAVDQANSVLDDGSPIERWTFATYNVEGPGTVLPAAGNPANCSTLGALPVINPVGYPKAIGTQQPTSVDCSYLYTPKANDEITMMADPHDNVAECVIQWTIPEVPLTPICEDLNLTTSPSLSGNTIPQGSEVDLATDPRDTDGNSREPVVYNETGNGQFVADPANDASCPEATSSFEAPSNCKYTYQAPDDGSEATVSVKVKEDDGVAACTESLTVPPTEEEICLALNLRVDGQYTLDPDLKVGESYLLQVDPMTDQGNQIDMVEWTESGDGVLIGDPGNPGICPGKIDNGSVVTLSVCRYIFASNDTDNEDSFSLRIRAVPDDNVDNCTAESADYQPPEEEEPYCLYLDLNYRPRPFQTEDTTTMDATVMMSDGSEYNDMVRFVSTDGSGRFNGGYSNTDGDNTDDFRTNVDNDSNTRNVTFNDADERTGVNVMLWETDIKMSAACMRQLRPVPQRDEECEAPPRIREKSNNRYCAEEGVGTDEYCWEIEGPGDLYFSNGRKTSTGDCVTLDDDYTNFVLRVEDCRPKYDWCADRMEVDETPDIEKRISTNGTRFSTKVNFTRGGEAINETVYYELEFDPSNFQGDNNYGVARIYDPAFTGQIDGIKLDLNEHEEDGGYIEFDLPDAINIDGYDECDVTDDRLDKCFRVDEKEGYLEIWGIDSDKTIVIEYKGTLHSGISLEDCRKGEWCNERFVNKARVDEFQFCWEEEVNGELNVVCEDVDSFKYIESNTTVAEIACGYLLTRASGDIYLEDDLQYGIDVSRCYPFKNASSTVVKPRDEIDRDLSSTGTLSPDKQITINHEICSAGQNNFDGLGLTPESIDALKELYGLDISKNLSSQICEVGLAPGEDWDRESIDASIKQNVEKLTRWMTPQDASTITNFDDTTFQDRVFYFEGNGNNNKVTINNELSLSEGQGAYTIIIKDADLYINDNIKYSVGTPTNNPADTASLGVIVLNGNIFVDKDVTQMDGAYFVQREDDTDYSKGNLFSWDKTNYSNSAYSENQLTIHGSIFGNIGPLFEHRIASGDIEKDEGAITIRYDQRMLQNPPPGFSELVGSLTQGQIVQ